MVIKHDDAAQQHRMRQRDGRKWHGRWPLCQHGEEWRSDTAADPTPRANNFRRMGCGSRLVGAWSSAQLNASGSQYRIHGSYRAWCTIAIFPKSQGRELFLSCKSCNVPRGGCCLLSWTGKARELQQPQAKRGLVPTDLADHAGSIRGENADDR